MRIYDRMAIQIDGNTVAEITELDVQYLDSDQLIFLLGGGGVGAVVNSPGERYSLISWVMVTPTELSTVVQDLTRKYVTAVECRLGVVFLGSSRQVEARGKLVKPRLTSKTSSNTTFNIGWVGPQQAF